jgi:predicted sugar kinase
MIVEAGKRSEDEISPLLHRVPLPEDWRFLLIRSTESEGLSGENERQAFGRLPPVPVEVTARMCQDLLLELIPAAIEGDFSAFSKALFRFGEDAGRCFAPQQGGVYGSAQMTWAVEELCKLGVAGVAQSSWGPTVFAVLPDQHAAEEIQAHFERSRQARSLTCTIARPRNEPARMDVILE